jgi:integrase
MLTDQAALAAPPKERPYHLADGNGLYLLIPPRGGKSWVLRYSLAGRRSMAGLGILADTTVALARRRAEAARALIAVGQKPNNEAIVNLAQSMRQADARTVVTAAARKTRSIAAMRTIDRLTDIECRAAAPAAQPTKIADGGGLHLVVQPGGSKSWVFRYKLAGVSQMCGFGSYPDTSLARARELRDDALAQIAAGEKPLGLRRAQAIVSQESTFAAMVDAWMEANALRWTSHTSVDVRNRLQKEVLAQLGNMRPADVTPALLMERVFAGLLPRSHDLAMRVRQSLVAAFRFGKLYPKVYGIIIENPAEPIIEAFGPKPGGGNRDSLIEPDEFRAMLRVIEAQTGQRLPKLLNRFQALTGVRPGEARFAQWSEFHGLEGDTPVWRIPKERMKPNRHKAKNEQQREHLVPLSPQAVDVIRVARSIVWDNCRWVFPQNPAKPLSEGATASIIMRAGYRGKHSPHGWRTSFSSTMKKLHPGWEGDRLVEEALAHAVPGVPGIYDRDTRYEERRPLMCEWASILLDGMPDAATIIAVPVRAPSNGVLSQELAA